MPSSFENWRRAPGGSAATTVIYASLGRNLFRYELDVGSCRLSLREPVELPDTVQYAWPHPDKPYLYVVSSKDCPRGGTGVGHHLTAFYIDPRDGGLTQIGRPAPLRHRPIHMSLDRAGNFALIAYANPSAVSVHGLRDDGSIGAEIPQAADLETGIYPHQILAMPGNKTVVLVCRGYNAEGGRPEEPGALQFFTLRADGQLVPKAVVAPNGGLGFGPRHLDFHPHRPWVYVSLERQSALQLFAIGPDGALAAAADHSAGYLRYPDKVFPRQMGGTVHVHPNGRFVYAVNRPDQTAQTDGKQVLQGGENSLVVFSIDQKTGELALLQHIDPLTIHVRTFTIDATGQTLVAAGILPLWVDDDAGLRYVPAALSTFRIGQDGRLAFVEKHDIPTHTEPQWWMGSAHRV
ncbi:beta-propeller fold lactonase family protein [Bordetella petrii]|nr:beta-propeller fold lactonase family protein [Bordetella petrii]